MVNHAFNLAYVGSNARKEEIRDSDSWYTPASELSKVRAVLKEIDVDPFSCRHANKIVQAKKIFTEKNSCLIQSWFPRNKSGSVFMNPPYSRGVTKLAVDKFVEQWSLGKINEAIVLVNNATETTWFQTLLDHTAAICLVAGRIGFYNNDGKAVSNNTRGQVYFYFGNNVPAFYEHFKATGRISVIAHDDSITYLVARG